jgi:endonuclease/exonuclease/phosphatase family metal-dependent hydrolase
MLISRRGFCSSMGVVALGALSRVATAGDRQEELLRVIAYNVYGCSGWPENRRLAQKAVSIGQMAERLAMELALHEPDIVTFSESPGEDVVREIAQGLEMNWTRFPSGGQWPGTLLTRLDIIESENAPVVGGERPPDLFTRHWGRCSIRLPNRDPLIVHSAHLMPGADPSIRAREIEAMLAAMEEDRAAGRSMLLMGDLNHGPETTEYSTWIDAGWVDTFAAVGKGEGATIRSDTPQWRIDYVMAAGPIAEQVVQARPLFEGAFRLNIDDPESFALSDHLPQFAAFDLTRE